MDLKINYLIFSFHDQNIKILLKDNKVPYCYEVDQITHDIISKFMNIHINWMPLHLVNLKYLDNHWNVFYTALIPETTPLLQGEWVDINEVKDDEFYKTIIQKAIQANY